MAGESRTQVGEGVLRRDGHLYRGEITVLGVYVELHAQVAEDGQGKHFKLQAFYDKLPAHLRVPFLDDPPPAPHD